jgi:hypothetical protein
MNNCKHEDLEVPITDDGRCGIKFDYENKGIKT